MEHVHSYDERPLDDLEFVAVAIKAVDPSQRHLALLHRSSGDLFQLDLASHHELRNFPFRSSSYLWIDPQIPRLRAQQVAARCRQIWKANGKDRIPYGFSPPTDCFDTKTHDYLLGPSQYGLTCASFVLAVFELAGLRLIDYDTWPTDRVEDHQWQQTIADRLESHGVDAAHVAVLRDHVGVARFRPEEVAAGAAHAGVTTFETAEPLAGEIVDRLSSPDL